MASKQLNSKRSDKDTSKKKLKKVVVNPNSKDQVQLLLHLLLRARSEKLDILGVVWEDTDLGKSAYCDFFDLPKQELSDMLENLTRVVELS